MRAQVEARLEGLSGLISSVLQANSLDRAMQLFITKTCNFFGADYGLFIYCTEKKELIHLESHGLTWLPDSEIIKNIGSLRQSGRSLAPQLVKKCKVLNSGLPISETSAQIKNHIDYKGRDRLIFHRFFVERFASYISLPLHNGINVVGEITLGYHQDHSMSPLERKVLDLLAGFATIVLKATDQDVEIRSGLDILEAISQFRPGHGISVLSPIISKIVYLVGGCGAHLRRTSYGRDGELEAELADGIGAYYSWAVDNRRVISIPPTHPLIPFPGSQSPLIVTSESSDAPPPLSLEFRNPEEALTEHDYWGRIRSILVFPLISPSQGGAGAYLELHSEMPLLETDNRVAILGTALRALGKTIHIAEAEKAKTLLRDVQKKQLALLRDICRLIVNEGSFTLYKARVVAMCCSALSCELLTIFLYDRTRSALLGTEWYPRYDNLDHFEEIYSGDKGAQGVTGQVLDCKEGDAVLVNDASLIKKTAVPSHLERLKCLPSWRLGVNLTPVAHLLAVPIIGESGKVFGALRAVNKKSLRYREDEPHLDPVGFNSDDEELCKTIASIIAQSLAAERRADKLKVLHLLGSSVEKATSEEMIGKSVVKLIVEDLTYSACSFHIIRDDRLFALAHQGFRGQAPYCLELTLEQGLAARALSKGCPVVALDVTNNTPSLNPDYENQDLARAEGLRSACCVPIKDDSSGRSYGVFVVYMRDRLYDFLEYEKQLMETIATVASVALEKIRWARMLSENEDCLRRLVDFVEILQLARSRAEIMDTGFPEALRILQADTGLFFKPANKDEYTTTPAISVNAPKSLTFPQVVLEAALSGGQFTFLFSDLQEGGAWLAEGFKRGIALNLDAENETLGIIVALERHDRAVTVSEDLRNKVAVIIRRQFVSALKKLEIASEREKLDRAVPAIVSAELVSGMVHEIRAQANTAMSKCAAIRRQSDLTTLGKKAQLDFTTIEESVFSIGDLAKRYLNFDYDNIRQGLEADLEYCSFNSIVDDVLFSMDGSIREKSARIERKFARELNRRHIYMDRRYFKLALENLIRNSLRWISQGGRVRIETGLRTEFCFVRVTDDGPGIPPEHRGKIFDAFFSRSGGFGLGLTISKYIVERMHKGKLVLLSGEQGDTAFEIRLSVGQS